MRAPWRGHCSPACEVGTPKDLQQETQLLSNSRQQHPEDAPEHHCSCTSLEACLCRAHQKSQLQLGGRQSLHRPGQGVPRRLYSERNEEFEQVQLQHGQCQRHAVKEVKCACQRKVEGHCPGAKFLGQRACRQGSGALLPGGRQARTCRGSSCNTRQDIGSKDGMLCLLNRTAAGRERRLH